MSELLFKMTIKSGRRTLVSIDRFAVGLNTLTFLFGESGIGKSMIAKALYGLLDGDLFTVTINNRPYGTYLSQQWARDIRENSFFVFQEPSTHLNPLMTVADQLTEGSIKSRLYDESILKHLWNVTDISALSGILSVYPKPYRPSGGEKQRVLLAMAFKKLNILFKSKREGASTFYVFDEPTGSLDNRFRNLFIDLLLAYYRHRPFTALIITHDYSIISRLHSQYRSMLPSIQLQELARVSDTAVALRTFSSRDYLDWLEGTDRMQPSAASGQRILECKPHFSMYGRSYTLCKDPVSMAPCDLVIPKGGMAYLKAESGAGKTTFAKILLGLVKPQRCAYTLAGIPLDESAPQHLFRREIWGRKACMVFQHADEALNPQTSVREVLRNIREEDLLSEKPTASALSLFFRSECTGQFLRKKIMDLSGGQKQRLNLLRALLLDTDLIILDEPLNGLDLSSIKRVLAIVKKRQSEGISFLIISHNEEIFESFIPEDDIYHLTYRL